MAASIFALRLPCLSRPDHSRPDEKRVADNRHTETTRHPETKSHAETSLSQRRKVKKVEAEVIHKVSLDKVRVRCSNATTATARYHRRDVTEDYKVLSNKVLGEGCSGKVIAATNRATGRKCAVKRIKKNLVSQRILGQLVAEVEICLTLDHPNIVRLDDVYDTNQEIAIVTELLDGGELYGRLHEAKIFTEQAAAETTRQMLRAVGYLHAHNIVHRDLKLENIMYESKARDSPVKVIDFGFAKVWDSDRLMQASCGSVAYVSPDVLCGHGYTSQCDLWSLGVIVFMLLAGYPPFHGNDEMMRKTIVAAEVDWHHPRRWAKVSQDAVDFVKALLVRDPSARLDAQAALNHRWLSSTACDQKPILSAATLKSIENYACVSPWRRAVLQLVARELAPDDVTDLRRTFLELAGEKEGTVRLSELKSAIRGCDSAQPQQADVDPKTPTRRLRRAKTEKLAELFDVMDVNGDEQIYYSDFLAATMNSELTLREENLKVAFRRLDADNSGAISAEDIQISVGERLEGVETWQLVQDSGLSPSKCEIGFEAFVGLLGRVQPTPEIQKPNLAS